MSLTRIAVLIDADNISAKQADAVMEEMAKYGVSNVKRAYGDWSQPTLSGWKAMLNEHGIHPVQQFAYTTGKNSTDTALIIDAMDLLYSNNFDAFAIVSSDSDFTRLAARLRESGKTVYGLGMRKTPKSLVAACNTFIYLEVLTNTQPNGAAEPEAEGSNTQPVGDAADENRAKLLPNLQGLLTRAVHATSADDGWAHLSAIGTFLRSADSSFDPRLYGAAKLITLVGSQPYLTTSGEGAATRVGLKGQVTKKAAAKKSAAKQTAAKKSAAKRTAKKPQSNG